MIRSSCFVALTATLSALAVPIAPAHAQLARTFVSSFGSDTNDCNRLTPCRTFQRAHDNTLSAGEITVLGPGGYGTVTITKAISIINDGIGEAGILVSGGSNGVTVVAAATDAVSLCGLTIKGIGFGGGNGIAFNTGATLTIENCAIRTLTGTAFKGFGVVFQAAVSSHLAMLNTIVADNSNDGVHVEPTLAASVRATFTRVQVVNNGSDGLLFSGTGSTGTINAVVEDSIAAKNGSVGFEVFSGAQLASVMVIRSIAAHNAIGISSGGAAAIFRIGHGFLLRSVVVLS